MARCRWPVAADLLWAVAADVPWPVIQAPVVLQEADNAIEVTADT